MKKGLFPVLITHPTYLLSNLLIEREAGEYGQREDHHSQTVVGQEVDQRAVERLHVGLRGQSGSEPAAC